MPWSSRNTHKIKEVCDFGSEVNFFTITATMVDATTILKADSNKKSSKYRQLAFELQRSRVSVKRNRSPEIKSLAVRRFLSRRFLGRRFLGRRFLGRRFLGRRFLGRRFLGRRFLGRRFLGRRFLGRRFLGRRFLGRRFLGRRFLGRRFLGRHFLGRRFLGRRFLGRRRSSFSRHPPVFSLSKSLISRKQLREIELQMVSAISFGWFADFGKTLTII